MNEQNTSFAPPLQIVGQLRDCLTDILPDAETLWKQSRKNAISFRGHLALDSDQAYPLLRQQFAELGYTPLFRRQKGYDLIIAIQHIFESQPQKWGFNLILLVLTILTTTLMGAVMEQGELLLQNPGIFFEQPWLILSGLPSACTIIAILGTHELAHYFAARKHGLESSLPYFIPVPFGFGTMGAIIRIRTPWENRKALFDVGLSGPLAGLAVALPIFFIGLLLSPAQEPIPGSVHLGSPLLLTWMEKLVYLIRDIPPNYDIYVNATTFAAWFGIIITGFNLLPVGQLDGGHVSFAVLGHWSRTVGIVVLITLGLLGAFVWNGWFVWLVSISLFGWQHPAPLNMISPLDTRRRILGILTLVLLILIFAPAPFPVL